MRRWLLAVLIALVFSAPAVALLAPAAAHGDVRAHQSCAELARDTGPADLARAGVAAVEPSRFAAIGGSGGGTADPLPDSVTRAATRAELQVWRT
ncbi:hypothetical protein [Phytohabitans aurantiacus]|uniref:hypothetical protein n=1 Tax=Phytohabitans aurantiacus TaxID=3016789 RepID=UPI002492A952|nr:hypothetical protein [Phytohabitans aurantiacus]